MTVIDMTHIALFDIDISVIGVTEFIKSKSKLNLLVIFSIIFVLII